MNTNNRARRCRHRTAFVSLILVFLTPAAWAGPRVGVLAFELNDLTRLRAPQEVKRTASLAPLLRHALQKRGYDTVSVPLAANGDSGRRVEHLFKDPASAASLGRRSRADWVIAGKLQKDSYLFAFITVRVVDVHTRQLIGEFNTRIEGPMTNQMLTRIGIQRIAEAVDSAIRAVSENGHAAHTDLLAPQGPGF